MSRVTIGRNVYIHNGNKWVCENFIPNNTTQCKIMGRVELSDIGMSTEIAVAEFHKITVQSTDWDEFADTLLY